ncbi:hypothetical protein BN1723_015486 [Verticillium longisporum]|uniref:Major facilitator superfamily (MFS) profile domain-containing protein n=1 Tax=Verticillium longisporum TaxID=100787 RepID=A0A0G4MZA4_VERLO|nr:hypothetical protein BN1723_015486 [Verticillium longisporum]
MAETHPPATNVTVAEDGAVHETTNERPRTAAEALRKLWTPKKLGIAISGLLVMNFFMNFTSYTQNVYEPYATSHFQGHSLLTTGSIINGIVRIVSYPLLAKLADHFGRPQGFAGAALSMAFGNMMFAACQNVDTFLAGGIFDSFGDTWWNITQQIFIADVTSLVNRGILFTLPESITAIPTLYAGTYLGEHILLGIWNSILPRKLRAKFPAAEARKIFGSIVVAQNYTIGSVERDDINEAYRETQQTLAIGSLCVGTVLVLLAWLAQNVKLGEEDEKRAVQADEELAWAVKARDAEGGA